MPVLGNPRHERAAQVLAGGGSAEAAAAAAEYNTKASSFSANARKLIQRAEIRERVRELQGEVASLLVEVTADRIKEHVAKIAFANVTAADITPSHIISANKLLAELIGALSPVAITGPDGGPVQIQTITRTIVEPQHPDSEDIPPTT
jgi:DNA-binding NtrC family response regulator